MLIRRASNKNLRLGLVGATNEINTKSNGTLGAALGFIAGLQLQTNTISIC